jgi:nucleoside-diphosphate-sugar epimerase
MSGHQVFLVTGAQGFIGRRLLARLQGLGRNAVGWSRADGDLRDGDRVSARLASLRPSHIIHLAAQLRPAAADGFQQVADECRMLTNLISAMPAQGRLIHAGSMAEYGYSGAFDEGDPCRPRTAYGTAKLAATGVALAARVLQRRDVRVARLFGVYGPGEAEGRLLPTLVTRLSQGLPVPLSDGMQVRDFIHVDDVCTVLMAMADADELALPLINVGTGVGVSVRQVCEMTAHILDADPALLRFGETPRRSVDEERLIARTERLAQLTSVPAQRWLTAAAVRDDVLALRTAVVAGREARQ